MAIEFDFKAWIMGHTNEGYEIVKENDNSISLKTEFGESIISFIDIEESTIVEFNITSYKDNETKFYLHFELNDESHAKQLYDEMVESLLKLKDEKTIRVLLSCSAGLTTFMFADKLQSTANMLNLDYEFNAVSYLSIFDEANDYDIILIAPQIGYMYNRLRDSLSNKLVLQIPTAIFAQYDAVSALKFIQEELEKYYSNEKEEAECCCECIEYESRILSIAIIIERNKARIYYQLLDHCEVVDSSTIIKPSFDIYDLYDIIDTVLLKHQSIDIIGIATPGIVTDNKQLRDPSDMTTMIDVKKDFEEKYNIDVVVYNNANAAAVGFAMDHPEYKNIVYHSHPIGFAVGGQGLVIDGKVVSGKRGVAGEIRYLIHRMQLSNDPRTLIRTHQGALELITKELLPTIAVNGPEAVALYSPMTTDMDEVKNSLSLFVAEEYLPEFYYIKDSYPLILNGITSMCVDYLEEQEQ